MEKKLIAIVGPTASGKTKLGVFLAKKLSAKGRPGGGEIVSADSRQVYRGLDIGTGKEGKPNSKLKSQKSRWIDDIPQWMIDVAEPEERFTLFDYLDKARSIIDDIFARGKVPIIVGGTGLYVSALTEGYRLRQAEKASPSNVISKESSTEKSQIQKSSLLSSSGRQSHSPGIQNHKKPLDPCLRRGDKEKSGNDNEIHSREELEKMSLRELQKIILRLKTEDSLPRQGFGGQAKLDLSNPRRLIRAIERAQGGEEMTKVKPDFESLVLGIDIPRQELYKRIDQRADERFKTGMLEETQNLIKKGVDFWWLITLGLDYRIMTQYLISDKKGEADYKEMVERFKFAEHDYARRQLTWWRKKKDVTWISDKNQAVKEVEKFLG